MRNSPFFKNAQDLWNFSPDTIQSSAIERLKGKISAGIYRRVPQNCLCNNRDSGLESILSKIDMHGILLEVVLCQKCGLIRSSDKFDEPSNAEFYKNEYRDLHNDANASVELYFNGQFDRGKTFIALLKSTQLLTDIDKVMEIGCGAGGILYAFNLEGKRTIGIDYNENFLKFGQEKGLRLTGVSNSIRQLREEAPDLLVLSHVMEHFLDPIEEMQALVENLREGKYLIVEVPGIFCDSSAKGLYGYPVRYFQIAHVLQFVCRDYLKVFYESIGLEVLHGDESATFLLKKPMGWQRRKVSEVYAPNLGKLVPEIEAYLAKVYFNYRYRPDWIKAKRIVGNILNKFGAKAWIKKLIFSKA